MNWLCLLMSPCELILVLLNVNLKHDLCGLIMLVYTCFIYISMSLLGLA